MVYMGRFFPKSEPASILLISRRFILFLISFKTFLFLRWYLRNAPLWSCCCCCCDNQSNKKKFTRASLALKSHIVWGWYMVAWRWQSSKHFSYRYVENIIDANLFIAQNENEGVRLSSRRAFSSNKYFIRKESFESVCQPYTSTYISESVSNYNQKRICIHIWFFIPKQQSYWLYKYIYTRWNGWYFFGVYIYRLSHTVLWFLMPDVLHAACMRGGLQRSTYVYTACAGWLKQCAGPGMLSTYFFMIFCFFSALISQNFCFLFWKKY